ncbi:Cys-tRNA(Pro) deacylase [Pseudarthrobacter sp. J1738]|uniref:Cys-tRNA(Pro) deacylase n=1 Tax=unclassified Pseudarthrobacter TaxID=2647000 RepID=UPI003D27AE0C
MAKTSRAAKGGEGTRATAVLAAAGISFTVHKYHHSADNTAYGLEAATELAIDPARVFKTLMVDLGGSVAVAVVPVSGTLNLKAIASVLGQKKAVMADPTLATRRSGYVLGGISPFGQRQSSPTVLDASAMDFSTILVSGGQRGIDIEVNPQDLLDFLGAVSADIRDHS